jgi:hypothetical protein
LVISMEHAGKTMDDSTPQSRQAGLSALPVRDVFRGLQVQMQEHPYETLALAAGIGFILGGGLFSKLGSRVVAAAMRAGLASAVSPALSSILQEVVPGHGQRPS